MLFLKRVKAVRGHSRLTISVVRTRGELNVTSMRATSSSHEKQGRDAANKREGLRRQKTPQLNLPMGPSYNPWFIPPKRSFFVTVPSNSWVYVHKKRRGRLPTSPPNRSRTHLCCVSAKLRHSFLVVKGCFRFCLILLPRVTTKQIHFHTQEA